MEKDTNSKETDQAASELDLQVEEFLAAWFEVRQQVQGLNFNRAHQHGLSTTQFIVLGWLDEKEGGEPVTISWLAARLNLDPATVVRTVDSLENRGLVQRRRDKQDRRQVFVEFTEEGRATQHSSHQRFKSSIQTIFSSMSLEGRIALVKGLQEFVAIGRQVVQEDGNKTIPSSD